MLIAWYSRIGSPENGLDMADREVGVFRKKCGTVLVDLATVSGSGHYQSFKFQHAR
jgi:hypothetical protein